MIVHNSLNSIIYGGYKMGSFSYKGLYTENEKRVLEINVLPEKYCNFDCIFCPIGRSKNKTDEQIDFNDFEAVIAELSVLIRDKKPDLIFINSKGEAFVNDKLEDIIKFIKSKDIEVRLLTNGYLLGQDKYKGIANLCDEIIGEIKVTKDEDFQKIQRPIDGYTLEEHVHHMVNFRKQYSGKFIFEITIVKGYNDDQKSVQQLKRMVDLLSPSEVQVVTIDYDPFKAKLGISDERLEEISKILLS